jgi:hypothetical protein
MYLKKIGGPRTVTLPNGRILSLADLPPTTTTRWVASRKAVVVQAVQAGLLTREAALERYSLSEEEFQLWEQAVDRFGIEALKVTHLQRFRQP